MIKHTQIICWQQLTNCLSVFDHFVGLALKGLRGVWLKTAAKSSLFFKNILGQFINVRFVDHLEKCDLFSDFE